MLVHRLDRIRDLSRGGEFPATLSAKSRAPLEDRIRLLLDPVDELHITGHPLPEAEQGRLEHPDHLIEHRLALLKVDQPVLLLSDLQLEERRSGMD